MQAFKDRRKDFVPSSNLNQLQRSPRKLPPSPNKPKEELKRVSSIDEKSTFSSMIDPETGEALKFTQARWTTKEGRLSLNAKTILEMGTGKLDIQNRSGNVNKQSPDKLKSASINKNDKFILHGMIMLGSDAGSVASSEFTPNDELHPLVADFMQNGPLTPMFHVNWNPISNQVLKLNDGAESSDNDNISIGDIDAAKGSVDISAITNPASKLQISIGSKNIFGSQSRVESESYQRTMHNVVPSTIENAVAQNWTAIKAKIFIELFDFALKIEENKIMTKEPAFPGGYVALKLTCRHLADKKVRNMQQVLDAVRDEAAREDKRAADEFAAAQSDKSEKLKSLKKQHQEQRMKGKRYIESLQREQEIVYMNLLREAGILW